MWARRTPALRSPKASKRKRRKHDLVQYPCPLILHPAARMKPHESRRSKIETSPAAHNSTFDLRLLQVLLGLTRALVAGWRSRLNMALLQVSGSALVAVVALTAASVPASAAGSPAPATSTRVPAAPTATATSRHACTRAPAPASNASLVTLSAPRRALAIGAAVVPGVVLHGAGHFAAGDTRSGLRLLAIGGAGAGLAAGSVAGLAITGASRHFAIPLVLSTITGAGFFMLTALADLYGVIMPAGA